MNVKLKSILNRKHIKQIKFFFGDSALISLVALGVTEKVITKCSSAQELSNFLKDICNP